jgi:NADPH:quinone reductase-like Zn-dependent oxidoreductase
MATPAVRATVSSGACRPCSAKTARAAVTIASRLRRGVVTKAVPGDGAFGEYVTNAEAYTARVPGGLDLATAGALGLACPCRESHPWL